MATTQPTVSDTEPITLAQLLAQPISMTTFMRAIAHSSAHDYSLAFMAIDKADSEHLVTDEKQIMTAMFARVLPHQLIALYVMRCIYGQHSAPYTLNTLLDIEQYDSDAIVLKRVLASREFSETQQISHNWVILIKNVISKCGRNYVLPILRIAKKLAMPPSYERNQILTLQTMISTTVSFFANRKVCEDINDTYAIMVALCELVETLVPGAHLVNSILCAMANKLRASTCIAQRAREDESPPCKKRA
jgi:hypothetical protein